MKIKNTFRLKGLIKFRDDLRFVRDGAQIEFLKEGPWIKAISVTYGNLPKKDWPTVKRDRETKVLNVSCTETQSGVAQKDALEIAALLGLFGCEGLEIDSPKINFISETKEEAEKLPMTEFAISYQQIDEKKVLETPIDLIARIVGMAPEVKGLKMPLVFLQMGREDISIRRYIDAFYDYFFCLELLFAEGKFKSKEVKARFRNEDFLQESVKKAIDEEIGKDRLLKAAEKNEEARKILEAKTWEITDWFVDVRGLLHHQSAKQERWSPLEHVKYEFHALLIQAIASEVISSLATKLLFSDERKVRKLIIQKKVKEPKKWGKS